MKSMRGVYDRLMARRDTRVDDYLLMSSPLHTLLIVACYLIAVTQGPKWMKDRQAFNLKHLIVFYNLCMVVLSFYIVYEFAVSSWLVPGFNLACEPVDYSNDPESVRLVNTFWWYYFSKIIELLDTVFFVLRKKNNQISFLHVYHHSTMPIIWWLGARFVGGGEAFFGATINSGIHVLMYLYYMLAVIGPSMQPYLWWKKYMTTLQLIQFVSIIIKTAYSIHLECGYSLGYSYAQVIYVMSQFALFANFYYHTYSKQARRNKTDSDPNTTLKNTDSEVNSEPKTTFNGEVKSNDALLQNGHVHARNRKVQNAD